MLLLLLRPASHARDRPTQAQPGVTSLQSPSDPNKGSRVVCQTWEYTELELDLFGFALWVIEVGK